METQPELTHIVERALTDAAETYLRYVVFEPQPDQSNILSADHASELHEVVWHSLRQVLLIWFDGDWDAVQQIVVYLEDNVASLEAFDKESFLSRCYELQPELPTSVELAEDFDEEDLENLEALLDKEQ